MAMTKSYLMTPDEQFLSDALKKGKAKIQQLSMKALGKPDASLQCRVQHLDVEHVRRLSVIHDETGSIAPIVVFEHPQSGGRWIADGFHRHRMLEIKRADSIAAYVIQGTRLDALAFSTMCNRQLCLPRSKDDIRKAIQMLLAEPEWLRKGSDVIAEHVGCASSTVDRQRLDYCYTHGINPEDIDRRYGKPRKKRKSRSVFRPDPLKSPPKRETTTYKDKDRSIEIPTVNQAVLDKMQEAVEEFIDPSTSPRMGDAIIRMLANDGMLAESTFSACGETWPDLWGLVVNKEFLITWVEYSPLRSMDIPPAVGRLLMLKRLLFPDSEPRRLIVLCEAIDRIGQVFHLAEKMGVRFVDIDRLRDFLTVPKEYD